MENKKMKLLGVVLFLLGALVNVVPELYSSVVCVLLMLAGLFLQFKNGVSKKATIVGIVFNVISILICTFFLIAEMQHTSGNFKLGTLPMNVTAIVSIALSVIVIILSVVLMIKKDQK